MEMNLPPAFRKQTHWNDLTFPSPGWREHRTLDGLGSQ